MFLILLLVSVMAAPITYCPENLPIVAGTIRDGSEMSKTFFVCAFEHEGLYFAGGYSNANFEAGSLKATAQPIMVKFDSNYGIEKMVTVNTAPQVEEIAACEASTSIGDLIMVSSLASEIQVLHVDM